MLPRSDESFGGEVLESLTPPKSLVDQVYEVILDALCDGTFKPGERLTQENIAARLRRAGRRPSRQQRPWRPAACCTW